ncbi:MAG: serine/threonine protein kinase [Myxococcales bacterium]|nr:serine/threonine protein kinase [Myxococcales bacterium]
MTSQPKQASQGALELPRAFGNYLLFDRIGRGGMAEIYLARIRDELGGSRRVVIKEVLAELSSDPGFVRMLVREAKLAAQLNHRNVVHVVDLGRESGRLFIAMEYVEGYDLNQLLRQLSRRRLPLPVQFAIFIIRETLAALHYAHRAKDEHGAPMGVVHRDVSPSNVLVSFEGEINLCDFGIARALDMDLERRPGPQRAGYEVDDSRVTQARVAGKSAYMAPEHARGEHVDLRSDIFAAGILLWELCAGRRLYKGSEEEMLEMARRGEVPPLPSRRLPEQPRVQAILDRALAVDPAARYQSAAEMLEDLEEYALATSQMASQLKFGSFLTENFSEEIVALRRARERAAEAALHTENIPFTDVEPVTLTSEPPSRVQRRSSPEPDAHEPPPSVEPEPGKSRSWLLLVAAALAGLAAVAWVLGAQ